MLKPGFSYRSRHQLLRRSRPRPYQRPVHLASSTRRNRPSSAVELSIADASQSPRLSGPSLGYLVSELSATNLTTAVQQLRREAGTMPEAQRTAFRRVAAWVVAVPAAFGAALAVGTWAGKQDDNAQT